MSSKVRPLSDRVLVKREDEETKTAGGIVIPDSAAEKSTFGTVVALGPGRRLDNGDTCAPDLKVGDKVIFGKYSGSEVSFDGEDFIIMREDDILGVC